MADIGLNMVFSHIFDGLKMFFFSLYLMVYFFSAPVGTYVIVEYTCFTFSCSQVRGD